MKAFRHMIKGILIILKVILIFILSPIWLIILIGGGDDYLCGIVDAIDDILDRIIE